MRNAILGVLVVSAALVGCGGGSEGDGGGGELKVTFDTTSLTMHDLVGASSHRVHPMRATVSGFSGTAYLATLVEPADLASVRVERTGDSSATLWVQAVATEPGAGSGTVTVLFCGDPDCGSLLWSRVVPFTVTVFAVSAPADPLYFLVPQGASSAPRVITITPPDTEERLVISTRIVNGTTTVPWLTGTRTSPSTFEVQATTVGVTPTFIHDGKVEVGFRGWNPDTGKVFRASLEVNTSPP